MSEYKLQSLSEIFNKRIFRIPDFQRGYSWEEHQLEDFWEDLQNLHPDKIHYVGMLTVEPVNKEAVASIEKWQEDMWLFQKGYSAFYVIDGQQRLTTMIILVHEILNQFDEDEGINFGTKSEWVNLFLYHTFNRLYKSFVFGYEKDNPSDEYFKTKILEQQSSAADKYPETLYTQNLMNAKKFFEKKLKKLTKEELAVVFEKVINKFKFNYYEIDDSIDIHVAFETMNNRGKKLSKLELLKNRLIYLSTLLPTDEGTKDRLRRDINETWKTIYEYLGKNKENPLDDDDFLFNHWIMYFTYDRKQAGAFANFLLKEQFTAQNVLSGKLQIDDIKQYIESLAVCVKQWFYLFNAKHADFPKEITEYLLKLERIGMGAFAPMLMAVLSKEEKEEDVVKLLQECERFNFLVFAVSHRQSNTQNNHIYRMAKSYYYDDWNINDLINEIDYLTDGDENHYGWFDLDRFKDHIRELFQKNGQEGFYGWNGLRYFLYEYELHLQGDAGTKVTWEAFNSRTKEETIEHIYPQTPTEPYWVAHFKGIRPAERHILQNSLGNLLLLSRKKNSTLQNDGFDEKKCKLTKNGKKTGYYNGSYSEIEVAKNDEWTPEKIKQRGMDMLNFMEIRWHFKFSDWGIDKENLLLHPNRK